MTDKTAGFLDMNDEDRLRVIEMGTLFLSNGQDCMQMWNSAEWDEKLKQRDTEAAKHETEWVGKLKQHEVDAKGQVKKWETKYEGVCDIITDLKNDISNLSQSQNDTIRRAVELNKAQYESTIKQLNEDIRGGRNDAREREDKIRRDVSGALETTHISVVADFKLRVEMQETAHLESVAELVRRGKSMETSHMEILGENGRRSDLRIAGLETELVGLREKYETHLLGTSVRGQNSSFKGQDGEEFVLTHLNRMFPSGEIDDTHTTPCRGDFIVRDTGMCMMIETKNYTRNVNKMEIDKFYRDIDSAANHDIQCAIMVSMTSGVANRSDFEFEMRGGKPILFLHNVETSPDNIKIGANFFRMILSQTQIDFADKEILAKLNMTATAVKRGFKKQKSVLDKYYAAQLKTFEEVDESVGAMMEVLNIKY